MQEREKEEETSEQATPGAGSVGRRDDDGARGGFENSKREGDFRREGTREDDDGEAAYWEGEANGEQMNREALAAKSANVFSMLQMISSNDFYVKYHATQILCAMSSRRNTRKKCKRKS